jgi:hypothetical protein
MYRSAEMKDHFDGKVEAVLESTKRRGMQGIELGHPGTHKKCMASRELVF